jgi:hypothetical protein
LNDSTAKRRQIFSIKSVLSPNRTANTTVQRFRLRSTSDPPPNGPDPVPTPNAPDRPVSLPECMRMSKIRTMAMKTWRTPRIVYMLGRS